MELRRERRVGVDGEDGQAVLGWGSWQAGQLGVAEAVEGELRHKFFRAVAAEDEVVCGFGGAQVIGVEGSIGVQDFGEAQAHIGAGGAFHHQSRDSGEILAEVVDINAGLGLGDGLGGEGCLLYTSELNLWDARMWTTENPAMVGWQLELKQRGLLTAILSNMGDNVHANLKREFGWLSRFDVLVWSYQLGIAKPDAAIYRQLLKQLGTKPEETLFIDDREVNVEAARGLGMPAIQFSTVEQLRSELIAQGLDAELPLPG